MKPVILEIARKEGMEMNGQDRLLIRTRVATSSVAKDRHRQRMTAAEYYRKKPALSLY
ncbi:TPA: hypothetical protein ACGASP_002367 [Raoultella ornithinolytica]